MSNSALFLGFFVNLVIAVLIVRFIYYPGKQSKNNVFTFLAFNTIIYFVMSILANAELGIGVGFGLFAIFSVLRYRTSAMSTREMTYLFIVIALPVMNSTLMSEREWLALLGSSLAVLTVLFLLEHEWGFHYESAKLIRYERIELIKPENHELLIADLNDRIGVTVKRFEIGNINFLNDSAELKIYYDEPRSARISNEESFLEFNER